MRKNTGETGRQDYQTSSQTGQRGFISIFPLLIMMMIISCSQLLINCVKETESINRKDAPQSPTITDTTSLGPEGKRVRDVITIEVRRCERIQDFVERLSEKKLITKQAFTSVSRSFTAPEYTWLPVWQPERVRFEGLFKPGEYQLNCKDYPLLTGAEGEEQAVANAERLVRFLLDEAAPRYNTLEPIQGLDTYQQIILASIVEREAIRKNDYAKIASVFLNRLAIGSGLGSCVTVEYALGFHRPYLLYTDIEIDSPYNTYRFLGLPPGPIAFFTTEALIAVNKPIETNLYFFVYDWAKGVHYFAALYKDMEKNAQLSLDNFDEAYGTDARYEVRPYVDY